MKLILLAPGRRQGTVAKLLTQMDGSVQISTGDILRGAVAAEPNSAKRPKPHEARRLVSDDLIMGIMEKRLQEPIAPRAFCSMVSRVLSSGRGAQAAAGQARHQARHGGEHRSATRCNPRPPQHAPHLL